MLSIRLTRTGKIHDPHYRIVVQEKRSKLNGKAIDIIGHYHPAQKDKLLVIDADKAKMWMSKGAQASDTVTNLFVKQGILDKSHKIQKYFAPVEVAETPVVEETPAAAEASVEETPTEEVVAEEPVAAEETPAEEAETPAVETAEEK